ncbi:MATE family efflux transporter [Brachyspira hampsonii]|uniref:Multidrug export protein MepA n=1 Tax=Brachyspira hampsonii 30446 TaxID=1289135 RepID=A0A2U4F9K9_9SPIR|nr:MATE family efflux transporter [Brachyspira hampsonii]EKV58110.1 MATE efflux family protein [Brachyspira hampsonii 30446]MBW5388854.1 MATE family efflux transporter [Brachyspira hampsonii]MBW5393499.1 MATE family efflux transporter [Brachyspira hampsonii]OEJ19951.1 MATE family efflux transporter [Brachyspira hampsonii]
MNVLNMFIKYVSLNIFGMIGLSCYILADTFFVARGIGSDGLTALNIAIPIFNLINGIGLMLGMGSATKYAILKTQNKNNEANIIFTNSLIYILIISALFIIVSILFTSGIAYILGARDNIHSMTNTYIKMILLFSPMFMLNNVLLGFVRNDNHPKLAMTAMLMGSLFNIIFDYIFIFPFNMGIFGAVLATVFSPLISILILSSVFIKKKNTFFIVKPNISFKQFFEISSLGISFLITELSSGIVMIAFNIIILSIAGNIGVAAYGITANIALVIIAIFTGMGQGMQPIISMNYNNEMNINKIYKYAFALSSIISILVYIITYVFANEITSIFNRDNIEELQKISVNGLRIYFTAFIFAGYNIITCVYFSAMDKAKPSFIISILRGFIFIIPSIFILSSLFNMTGVWVSFPTAEILTSIFSFVFFINSNKYKRYKN